MNTRQKVFYVGGTLLFFAVAVTVALLVPTPSSTPAPASVPTSVTSSVESDSYGPQTLVSDLQSAGLPLLDNSPSYTQETVATAPCAAARDGANWGTILDLDMSLPTGPLQYGKMVAIGIRDECPQYLTVVPAEWMPAH
jgi:hypothetical protein